RRQTPVGHIGVAGPDLVAVDEVLGAVAGRRRRQRRQVRPRARRGEARAPPLGAVPHPRQEPLPQLLRSGSRSAGGRGTRAWPRPLGGGVLVTRGRDPALLLGQPCAQPGPELGLLRRITKVQWSTPPVSRATSRSRSAPAAGRRAPGTPRCCRYRRAPGSTSRR